MTFCPVSTVHILTNFYFLSLEFRIWFHAVCHLCSWKCETPFLCEENFHGRCETLGSAYLCCMSCWDSRTWARNWLHVVVGVERGDGSYSPGVFVHWVNLTLCEFLPNVLHDLGNHPPLVRLHRLVPKEKHVWMLPLFPPRAQHLEKAAQHCQAWLVNLPGVPLHLYMMENCKHGYSEGEISCLPLQQSLSVTCLMSGSSTHLQLQVTFWSHWQGHFQMNLGLILFGHMMQVFVNYLFTHEKSNLSKGMSIKSWCFISLSW